MTALGWIVLGPLGAAAVTFVAGRLLGARRGWLSLLVAGALGMIAAIVTAGALTGWEWSALDMVLLTLVFGTLFTMATALALDLVAPVGSLARGSRAGLVTMRNPLSALRRQVRPLRRYREVIALARRNGVRRGAARDDAAERRPAHPGAGRWRVREARSGRLDAQRRAAASVVRRAGPAAHDAEPAPEAAMRPHVTAELGADPATAFATFDWQPLASASISQVYRATLHDGTPVVVKVQRPGLDETLAFDGAVVMQIANLVERRTPLGLSVRPADLAQEFVDSVAEELDFGIELRNGVEMGAALADDRPGAGADAVPGAVGPPRPDRGVRRRAERRSPGERDATTDADLAAVADRIVELFLHQIFTVGTFHADPHPGNILLEPDGTIVLIDLGAVGHLGPGSATPCSTCSPRPRWATHRACARP